MGGDYSDETGWFVEPTVILAKDPKFTTMCEEIFGPVLTIYVYPDMKQLGEYALLARTNRLSLMGVRRTRHIGQDNEFERLRDYTLDDNYKHIDWRATNTGAEREHANGENDL